MKESLGNSGIYDRKISFFVWSTSQDHCEVLTLMLNEHFPFGTTFVKENKGLLCPVDHQHFWIQLSTFYWTKLGPIQLNTMRRYPNQGDQEITGTSCHNHAFILHLRSSYRPGICVKCFLPFPQKTCHQRKLRQTR